MLDDLFAAEPLDALVILSPNVYHFPYAIAAIERGLHALCEKPLAMTSGQARQLTEAAERAGVTTMTPFTYRFMPVTRYLKELVDERYIGRPYHLTCGTTPITGGLASTSGASTSIRQARAPRATSARIGCTWRAGSTARSPRSPRCSGTPCPARRVRRRPFPAAEHSAMILLQFENGATGSLHVSSVAHEATPFGHRHQM